MKRKRREGIKSKAKEKEETKAKAKEETKVKAKEGTKAGKDTTSSSKSGKRVKKEVQPRPSPQKIKKEKKDKEPHSEEEDWSSESERFKQREKIKEEPPPENTRQWSYWYYMQRGPPPMKGMKEVPTGAPNCLAGKIFLFTGVLDSLERDEAMDLVKRYGGKVAKSVTKSLTHAVVGQDPGPKKMQLLSQRKDVTILDEDGLFELIRTSKGSTAPSIHYSLTNEIHSLQGQKEKPKRKPASADITAATIRAREGPQTELWVDKYAPTKSSELIANPGVIQQLRNWLEKWTSSEEPKAALLSGRPGIGKTSAAHIIAEECGYDAVEFNASDYRSKKAIKDHITQITQHSPLSKFYAPVPHEMLQKLEQDEFKKFEQHIKETKSKKAKKKPPKTSKRSRLTKRLKTEPKEEEEEEEEEKEVKKQYKTAPKGVCLIMDEVDGMSAADRGGLAELITLIKNTRVPIICICNDRQKVRTLASYCLDLHFRKPTVIQALPRIQAIAEAEGFTVEEVAVEKLLQSVNGDIRQAINLLQLWSTNSKELKYFDTSMKQELKSAMKDIEIGVFDAIPKIFSRLPFNEKLNLYFLDSGLVPLFIQENYPTACKDLDSLVAASESISDGDLVDTVMRSPEQAYELMNVHSALSTVRPAELTHGYTAGLKFPSWLGKNSSRTRRWNLLKVVEKQIRPVVMCTKEELRLHYLPVLFHKLTEPLIEDGIDGIDEVIEWMDSYDLSKEDWDAIVDIAQLETDITEEIPSNVKAAFTRTYNNTPHALRVASSVSKRKARKSTESEDELEPDITEASDEEEETVEGDDIESDKLIKPGKPRKSRSRKRATSVVETSEKLPKRRTRASSKASDSKASKKQKRK